MSSAIIEHDLLLPLLEVIIHKSKKKCKFNCLLDTGIQRSYFSAKVVEGLVLTFEEHPKKKFDVKTFIEQKTKTLREISLKLLVGNNNIISNILVDDNLSLDFSVKQL